MDAQQRTYMLEQEGEPLYLVVFDSFTMGTYALADEDVDDVRAFEGVKLIAPLNGAYLELDPRALQQELASRT